MLEDRVAGLMADDLLLVERTGGPLVKEVVGAGSGHPQATGASAGVDGAQHDQAAKADTEALTEGFGRERHGQVQTEAVQLGLAATAEAGKFRTAAGSCAA
jgi:hypothetical protein